MRISLDRINRLDTAEKINQWIWRYKNRNYPKWSTEGKIGKKKKNFSLNGLWDTKKTNMYVSKVLEKKWKTKKIV